MINDIPEDAVVAGRLEIVTYLTSEGEEMGFLRDDMSYETAIGCLDIVLDRLREERKLKWETCPECLRPWEDHDDEEDDED